MRIYAITAAILGLAGAGPVAAQQVSDVDYLKANRCKGLAASHIGAGLDTAGLDAFLKSQASGRQEAIRQKGEEIRARATREASRNGVDPRLTAELNGPCKAFLSGDNGVAGPAATPSAG